MLRIPPESLSPDTLEALIEEFVTRHGTDLTDAATKSAQVRAQLKSGEVFIAFDEKTESANIVPKDARETPPPPEPDRPTIEDRRPAPPRPLRHADEDGRRIVYDEPPPPDPLD